MDQQQHLDLITGISARLAEARDDVDQVMAEQTAAFAAAVKAGVTKSDVARAAGVSHEAVSIRLRREGKR